MQLRAFAPVSGWTAPDLSSLPSWKGAARVSIDTETCDPDLKELGPGPRRGGYVVGISIAIQRSLEDDPARAPSWYLPIRHEGGGNMDPARVLEYLRAQRGFDRDLVGARMPYDLDHLAEVGVEFPYATTRDVQVAEPLLDELQYSYGLEAIAGRNGLEGKDERLLYQAAKHFCGHEKKGSKKWNPKAHIWRLPARHVGPYAEQDAVLPLQVLAAQERRIRALDAADERVQAGKARSLWSLWELECRLLPVLVDMTRRGVRVDLAHLDVVEARCVREVHETCAALSVALGAKVTPQDLNRGAFVGPLLEAATGLTFDRTAKTGKVELDGKKLRSLHHPTVDLYLRARRFDKLRGTYVGQIRNHAIKGRVHCTFNQVKGEKADGSGDGEGTVSGRLSATHPSMQNQPVKDEQIGAIWRKVYLPEEGERWACCDLSSQEPRWFVHFAAESGCTGARELRDAYRADPALDLYIALRDNIGWEGDAGRTRTKQVYLALAYTMGPAKTARTLGLPTEWRQKRNGRWYETAGPEAEAVLNDFFRGAPWIRELSFRAERRAQEVGFVRTALGRICRFPRPRDGSPGYDFTHAAGNRIVQGSSADQVKQAMVDAHGAGIPLLLQVHDELDVSYADEKRVRDLAEIMLNAVPCTVPHLVKPEVGPSWGELELLDKQ